MGADGVNLCPNKGWNGVGGRTSGEVPPSDGYFHLHLRGGSARQSLALQDFSRKCLGRSRLNLKILFKLLEQGFGFVGGSNHGAAGYANKADLIGALLMPGKFFRVHIALHGYMVAGGS